MMEILKPLPTTLRTSVCVVSSFLKHIWKEHRIALIITTTVVVAIKVRHAVKRRKLRQKWNSAGENVVVLHTISRGTTCPNLSPYVLKLETYLRMAGIQYKRDLSTPFGPKGKFPWITLNGEDFTDSQLIMEFLGRKFNKDFSSHLSEEQKAVARAMLVMNDEHIMWGLIWWRFVRDPDYRVADLMKMPFMVRAMFRLHTQRKMPRLLWAQGIGRHTDDEIVEIIRKDLEALSSYLGTKKFMMGDTPCEVDCAVFGMMCQMIWGAPGSPFAAMLQSDYRNLQNFCFRIKEKFWPDWETILVT